jgi:hypothetical protein
MNLIYARNSAELLLCPCASIFSLNSARLNCPKKGKENCIDHIFVVYLKALGLTHTVRRHVSFGQCSIAQTLSPYIIN